MEKLWKMTKKDQKHYSVCALDHGAVKEGLLIRREVLRAIEVEEEEILCAWNSEEKQYYEVSPADYEIKEYVGKENEIGHVFNIKNMDYTESIEANQDIVSYLQEKIEQ